MWWYDGSQLMSYDGKVWSDRTSLIGGRNAGWAWLKSDSRQRIWILAPDTLTRVDSDGTITPVNANGQRLGGGTTLVEGRSGTLYYCDASHRIYSLKGKEWKLVGDGSFPDGYLVATAMAEDNKGRLWVADFNFGLFRYDNRVIKHVSRNSILAGWHIDDVVVLPDDVIRVSALRRTSEGTERKVFLCHDDEVWEPK